MLSRLAWVTVIVTAAPCGAVVGSLTQLAPPDGTVDEGMDDWRESDFGTRFRQEAVRMSRCRRHRRTDCPG